MNTHPAKSTLIKSYAISRKLALNLVLTVSVVLMTALIINWSYNSYHYKKVLNKKADETIEYLQAVLLLPLWNVDYTSIRQIGEITLQNDLIDMFVVKEGEDIIFFKDKKSGFPQFFRSRIIESRGKILGEVTIGVTTQSIATERQYFIVSFGMTLILIFISLYLSTKYFIHRSLQSPLKQLNSIVHSYASGNYSIKETTIPYMEFQPFGNVLSQMGATIESQMTALGQADILLKNLNEAVFRITVPDGICEYINPSVQSVFGYSKEDVATRPFFLKYIIHPDFKKCMEETWEKIKNNILDPEFEYRIIDKEGNARWILQSNTALLNEKGNIIAIQGCCSNITERKNAEEEKRELEDKLRQSQK
ncbi:hypothetical protein MTBBW1_820018 [Desulfamplus magnetovallimortis]|uniref:histidine kinase n=1 Tax=Desulfamplus magnetovallimortis TaxID=1246637 RepID=A0A1W1HKG4_9BACT|nr:PAS domain-containing protein [Desulfamplus magnetovallimortis]SLM32926.1 hypothetical protein MTBBW1_820018 [Desulfamplus magnetovallimortis]